MIPYLMDEISNEEKLATQIILSPALFPIPGDHIFRIILRETNIGQNNIKYILLCMAQMNENVLQIAHCNNH